ncbi:MAG: MutS family DNA mismatch repair protein, partial [Planctomycetota bacterium]
ANWLQSRSWLMVWANGSVGLTAIVLGWFLISFATGNASSWSFALACLLGIAVLNLIVAAVFVAPAAKIFSVAMASRRQVSEMSELLSAADWLPDQRGFASGKPKQASGDQANTNSLSLAQSLRYRLLEADRSAKRGMTDLARIAKAGGLKQAAATFFLYIPLQAFGLWDVRVLKRLEDWKGRYGEFVQDWFAALGEIEALLSLATLADENPSWVTPEWIDDPSGVDGCVVQMKQVGHPLLADISRVCNDVSLGPRGTLLLVTGSNMSGKSTMLRSVGLNIALATAGGPVCCEAMRLPAIELSTSIRVADDLSEGVSFYMAELNRLAEVVRHAKAMAESADCKRMTVFLLDEILQGTNSRERQIAVARVLRHLVGFGAIGAITTHDLELADDPDLAGMATTVHFRETITPDADGNDRMTFDYVMRQGVSPTTNALRLLEMVGLKEDTVATDRDP